MNVIIIDNYDSFTYNIFQYIAELSQAIPAVYYNDQLSWKKFQQYNPDAVIISPGPGNPSNHKDFGISSEIIKKAQIPILGICLGHQGIGKIFGGEIIHAPEIMHGRPSAIYHNNQGLFKDIPQGFKAIRYHSLIVNEDTLPSGIIKIAWTTDNIIMGIQHKQKPIYGIQFHPESIGTSWGKKF